MTAGRTNTGTSLSGVSFFLIVSSLFYMASEKFAKLQLLRTVHVCMKDIALC
jgi:hypothetical protein